MKRLYATAVAIAATSLLLCCSTAIAFDFGVYPGRFHCTGGYDYMVQLELQDNITQDMTIHLTLQQPPTPDDGYTPLPNMSWVSFSPDHIVHNTTIIAQGKPHGQTRYQITQVPVYIDIPDKDEYNGKQWEIDSLAAFPTQNNSGFSISRRARQRILIETPPEIQEMSLLPLGILLLSLAVAFAGYGIYLKKRKTIYG